MLYLQFTNPTAYPPLQNGAGILLHQGWKVRFLGVRWPGSGNFSFGAELDTLVDLLSAPAPGWKQKLFYLRYSLSAVLRALKMKPYWIYVSDPMAAPAGLLLKLLRFRVIYHEHDSPPQGEGSMLIRLIGRLRGALARKADLNILPQTERIKLFRKDTGTHQPIECVWNCPLRASGSVQPSRERIEGEPLKVYFHGSINLDRVPLSLIDAASRCDFPILIRVVGYETVGSAGVSATLSQAAELAGPNVHLELPGSVDSLDDLKEQMQGMHVGWIAYRLHSGDVNLAHLAGASNKAFDYLAAGMPLLIRDGPDWQLMFGETGYAKTCDPEDPNSIAQALHWFYANPQLAAEMGEQGRQRILKEWNYETQFGPILEIMEKAVS